jgi:ERCC4-related helicase
MPRAVSKLGLAFVAWTRATKWSKVAFQSIPPLEEFLAVRLSREFQLRETFETKADDLHQALLESRGITNEMQIKEHCEHLDQNLQGNSNRYATEAERNDMRNMLEQRGVKPVSDSVKRWGEKQTAKKGGGGLWAIVSSFRADRRVKDAGDLADAKNKKKPKKEHGDTAVASTTTWIS